MGVEERGADFFFPRAFLFVSAAPGRDNACAPQLALPPIGTRGNTLSLHNGDAAEAWAAARRRLGADLAHGRRAREGASSIGMPAGALAPSFFASLPLSPAAAAMVRGRKAAADATAGDRRVRAARHRADESIAKARDKAE